MSEALQISQMVLVSIFCIFVAWEQVTLTHFHFVCFAKYQSISGILWVWPGETRNVGMGRLSSQTVSAEADWACSQHFLTDTSENKCSLLSSVSTEGFQIIFSVFAYKPDCWSIPECFISWKRMTNFKIYWTLDMNFKGMQKEDHEG